VKVGLDTNVLAYASGIDDDARREISANLITRLGPSRLVVATQVAGELFNVLTKKGRRTRKAAVCTVMGWQDSIGLTSHDGQTMSDALDLASRHELQIWDALIICVAAEAGCRLLLSEDMRDGSVYREVTIANPFAVTPHPLLASLLQTLSGTPE
jgi:predicted nucleic acid-binding protein